MNARNREAIGLALSFAGFAATLCASVDARGVVYDEAIYASNAFAETHGGYHACVRAYYRALDVTLEAGEFNLPEEVSR